MAGRLEVGSSAGLRLRIEWQTVEDAQTAADLTLGEALLWIADELVWGKNEDRSVGGLTWTWIELLEFLAQAWVYLEWEEGCPLGLQPANPAALREAAESRWQEQTADRVEEEVRALYAFQENHDLARALQGAVAAPVWLLREGDLMWVASQRQAIDRPAREILDQLEEIGELIKRRVEASADPRARIAIAEWSGRRERSVAEIAEIAVGLPAQTIRQFVREEDWTDAAGKFQVTELLAAARFVGGSLAPDDCRKTVQTVADTPRASTAQLDALTDEARAVLHETPGRKPYDCGYALAIWFRTKINCHDAEPVNPRRLLQDLGVSVQEITLQSDHLDAIACWGPRHGPAVILNTAGKHAQNPRGSNATLAHELCHLLIDRDGALPLVEVLNGRAPLRVEARARAFAAELLLPRKLARTAVEGVADMVAVVRTLQDRYAVSQELAAWQILNSDAPLLPDQHATLRSMVSGFQRL